MSTYANFLCSVVHMVLGIDLPLNVQKLFNRYPRRDDRCSGYLLVDMANNKERNYFDKYKYELFCKIYFGNTLRLF